MQERGTGFDLDESCGEMDGGAESTMAMPEGVWSRRVDMGDFLVYLYSYEYNQ